jgi:mRNA interferase MazF
VRARPAPWQIWWINFSPAEGREQQGVRPGLIVSSAFHLALTAGALISVLPMTTTERPEWLHRLRIDIPGRRGGFVITEQVRTVSAARLQGQSPLHQLEAGQVASLRKVLAQMLDL